MKRTHRLFALAAILATLIPVRDAFSQPPPLVVCEDGKCTMTEEDWKQLREYHNRVREFVAQVEKKNRLDNLVLPEILQKLQSCTAILRERKA